MVARATPADVVAASAHPACVDPSLPGVVQIYRHEERGRTPDRRRPPLRSARLWGPDRTYARRCVAVRRTCAAAVQMNPLLWCAPAWGAVSFWPVVVRWSVLSRASYRLMWWGARAPVTAVQRAGNVATGAAVWHLRQGFKNLFSKPEKKNWSIS
jgi:hypothetical protein